MSTARTRQLQGLTPPDRAATVPPPKATRTPASSARTDPAGPSTPTPNSRKQPRSRSRARDTTRASGRSDHGKHRRAVTVPTALVEQLRQRAHELDRYHTDLILDCLAATATALQREHDSDQAPTNSPFQRPRRRAHRGRTMTTLTLYLTGAEVHAMDTLATRLGMSRSAIVAVALDRAIEQLS